MSRSTLVPPAALSTRTRWNDIADESPDGKREDRLGPRGTRSVTLVLDMESGPDGAKASESGALAAASRSDSTGSFGMGLANMGMEGTSGN